MRGREADHQSGHEAGAGDEPAEVEGWVPQPEVDGSTDRRGDQQEELEPGQPDCLALRLERGPVGRLEGGRQALVPQHERRSDRVRDR
jgi:hypothetical protein